MARMATCIQIVLTITMTNISIAGGGLLLVAAVAFLFIRRRNAAEEVDASAFDNPLGEENPFAGFEPEAEATTELIDTPAVSGAADSGDAGKIR